MGHGHGHAHGHGHGHGHHHHEHDHQGSELPAAFDTSVPDEALTPEQHSRRSMLRRAGLLGAGLTAAGVLGGTAAAQVTDARQAAPSGRKRKGFLWLAA